MSIIQTFLTQHVQNAPGLDEVASYIEDGNDINKKHKNLDGHTFLTLACYNYRDDIVAKILECKNADVNAESACRNRPLRWLLSDATEDHAIHKLSKLPKVTSKETYFMVLDELTARRKRCAELLFNFDSSVSPDSSVNGKRKIGNCINDILCMNITSPYPIRVFEQWLTKKQISQLTMKLEIMYSDKGSCRDQ